ncbi:hypothetical protein GOP47_0011124 [Adiantum capillus-veneris]|uniref:Uncharacterized protein n=1 Tax=Adiantum capillus-veneris TaxID=13818 RepID=A0A9D4USP6_ADICA|nr:hypothetical protein GOP47_0011124 [Adiantum capillus-veneris]
MGSCFTKPEISNSRGSVVVPYCSPQAKRPGRLRLYGTELCPFTSRIRIALEFKGIPVQVLWLSADDEKGRSKQLLAYMLPDGKLPILQHEDHTISGSSDEILDYIEGTFPKPSLSCNRGVYEWVEFVRDTFSPLIVKALYNGDLLAQPDTAKQLNSAFAKLDTAIVKHGSKGPYFYGDQFSLVDVYLVPFLLLERPLSYFHGIGISAAFTHLRGYSIRMTSFGCYAPIRTDLDLLYGSVSKALAQSAPPPLVSMTLLQHYSILAHFEKLVLTIDELILAAKQPSKTVDPVKGSLAMQIKKLSASYSLLLQFMLEHAQMEERVIFPALEKADRGLTKSANQSHARDLPVMNGIKEDFKSVVVLEQGSAGRKEALLTVSTRLRHLQAHTIEHFKEEETELLPLLNAAGVGSKQQAALVGKCIEIMESMHARLFPFMLSGLQPHQIHQYINLLQKSLEESNKATLGRMMTALKQADDEHASVWAVVRERFPSLAILVS